MRKLFKSGRSKAVRQHVIKVGNALHKQIKVAENQLKRANNNDAYKRLRDTFTAGYLHGYVQASFEQFTLSEEDLGKCMQEIFDGIFLGQGYELVMSRIEQLGRAEDMGTNRDIGKLAIDLGGGIDAGRLDAALINAGKQGIATRLSLYVLTGKTRQAA